MSLMNLAARKRKFASHLSRAYPQGNRMQPTINTGLIGFGLAGSAFHAPIIETTPGLNLVAINSSRTKQIQSSYPNVQVYQTPQQILQDSTIKLVVIASPTSTHYDLIKQALHAGKHVVIDKPFVITSHEAKELITLAKHKNKQLCVYQNRRWDNDFLTIKALIQDKTLGNLYHFESHFDRFRPYIQTEKWREQDQPGSGLLYDLGAHLIDQALALFGMPHWVQADVSKQRPNAVVDDYFHIIFGYDQLRVILHSSSVVKASTPRFTLHGDQGSFVKFGLDPQEAALRAELTPENHLQWGVEDEALSGALTTEGDEKKVVSIPGAYPNFYQHVYESITKGKPFPITQKQAVQVIHLIEVSKQSADENRRIFIS